MYDPKFTQKQMYEQYGKSLTNKKKADPKPPSSSGFSGMGADPAERFGGSPTRGLGAKTRTFGGGQDNNPNRDEAESRGVVARVYERAVTRFRNFGASKPDDVIVDGKKVYQGPAFRGFTPTIPTQNFGGEYGKKSYFGGMGPNFGMTNYPRADVSPTLPPSTINIFGVNTDNPRLNMFGVERGSFRNPDPLELSVPPDVPANLDAITRALSQGMRPEPTVIDGEPVATIEVKAGQTLFDIRDEYNESILSKDKKITVEDIRKFNNISLDGMFGIKPGTELKLPIRTETEVDRLRNKVETERSLKRALIEFERLPESEKEKIRERYRLLEQAQPASMEFMDNETRDMLRGTTPTKANFVTESLKSLAGKLSAQTKKMRETYTTGGESLGDKDTSTYKVERGDTMYDIAKKQGVTLDKLMEANPDVDADRINVGQVISIPRGGELNELPPDVQAEVATAINNGEIKTKEDLTLKLYDASTFKGIPPIRQGENLIEYFARSGLIGVDEADPQFIEAFKEFGTGSNPKTRAWCANLLGNLIRKSGGSLPFDKSIKYTQQEYMEGSQNFERLGKTIYNHNPTTGKTYKGKPSDVKAGDIIIFNNRQDGTRQNNGDFKFPNQAIADGLGAGHISVVLEVRNDGSIVALGGNQSAGATSYITGGRSTGGIRASLYTPEVIKRFYKGGFKINRLTDTSLTQADPEIVAAIIRDAGLGGDGQ